MITNNYRYIQVNIKSSHKIDFNIEVLNLSWLSLLYIPHRSSFISNKYFVLNLVGLFGVLSNKCIIFWYFIIILLYQYQDYESFLLFFLRYISFFPYFFRYSSIILICNCLRIILLWMEIFSVFDVSLLYYFGLSSSIVSI